MKAHSLYERIRELKRKWDKELKKDSFNEMTMDEIRLNKKEGK